MAIVIQVLDLLEQSYEQYRNSAAENAILRQRVRDLECQLEQQPVILRNMIFLGNIIIIIKINIFLCF